jgi:hypothetical protein
MFNSTDGCTPLATAYSLYRPWIVPSGLEPLSPLM